jgi:hypothetical protein
MNSSISADLQKRLKIPDYNIIVREITFGALAMDLFNKGSL